MLVKPVVPSGQLLDEYKAQESVLLATNQDKFICAPVVIRSEVTETIGATMRKLGRQGQYKPQLLSGAISTALMAALLNAAKLIDKHPECNSDEEEEP